jgi:hypothetical protein
MSKLTDTQLIILSAASQRDDGGVELPTNIKGKADRKFVDKLVCAGLLEEIRGNGSLPVWRRDDESGPVALRITKQGLKAIDVEDESVASPETAKVPHQAPTRETAAKAIVSHKQVSIAAQKPAHKKRHAGTSKTPTGPQRQSRSNSKQARVLAMLRRPEGAKIADIMRATKWQQHSVRGFFARVVRKKFGLNLSSKKVDRDRIYRIVGNRRASSARHPSDRTTG